MFKFKFNREGALTPSVSHPGDLGYDLYAAEDTLLHPRQVAKVPTGVAVQLTSAQGEPMGFLVRDRSSMAAKGITVSGGVIDAGYRGEIFVLLTLHGAETVYLVKKGDKIAQAIPMLPQTSANIQLVDDFEETSRGGKGFGSSGK